MNKASIRVESLVIPTYPEPAKEEFVRTEAPKAGMPS